MIKGSLSAESLIKLFLLKNAYQLQRLKATEPCAELVQPELNDAPLHTSPSASIRVTAASVIYKTTNTLAIKSKQFY
jgi:hypothetical protein